MKKFFHRLLAVVLAGAAGIIPVLAQPQSMTGALNDMTSTVKTWVQPLVNLVLVAVGIFAVGRAVSAYLASRRNQQGGGNEELLSMIATTLIVVGFIFLVNVIFFR